jgi:hypothetical protein
VIEEGQFVRIASPSASAGKPPRTPEARVDQWAEVLGGAGPRILRHLFSTGGRQSTKAIAEELDLVPQGGHWNTAWKQLRDNNIVTVEHGVAALTKDFMPKSKAA